MIRKGGENNTKNVERSNEIIDYKQKILLDEFYTKLLFPNNPNFGIAHQVFKPHSCPIPKRLERDRLAHVVHERGDHVLLFRPLCVVVALTRRWRVREIIDFIPFSCECYCRLFRAIKMTGYRYSIVQSATEDT